MSDPVTPPVITTPVISVDSPQVLTLTPPETTTPVTATPASEPATTPAVAATPVVESTTVTPQASTAATPAPIDTAATTSTPTTATTSTASSCAATTPAPPKFKLSSGFESVIGRRPTMEDTHVCLNALVESPGIRAYYAVYDGHGGIDTAELAEQRLHLILSSCPEFQEGRYADALKASFGTMEEEIRKAAQSPMWSSGATAISILIVDDRMWVANLGDAEAVIQVTPTTGKNISVLHRPTILSERQRIEAAGGHVMFGRVLGTLAVSRAFGDLEFKLPYNRSRDHFVSPIPDITEIPLNRDVKFIIIACDGLWEKMNYDTAVALCAKNKEAGMDPTANARSLVQASLDAGTTDNVTCIVVYIDWFD